MECIGEKAGSKKEGAGSWSAKGVEGGKAFLEKGPVAKDKLPARRTQPLNKGTKNNKKVD